MSAAEILGPLVKAALGDQVPLRVTCWDGSRFGPADAAVNLHVVRRRALRRIMWQPNELGFARAYVSGDLVIEGDLWDGLAALDEVADPATGPGVQVDAGTLRALARVVLRLGLVGAPPRPPAEESRLKGRRHSTRRDAAAIAHHYDVGNDFYRVLLGPTMTYSCAYWPPGTESLEAAQEGKCELVARKLDLRGGMRVLDVGCGWGTFAIHAAKHHGAHVVGVTLSEQQARLARERVAEAGVADLVEIRVQDYRHVDDGPYDAISSIGMAEHVGYDALPGYANALYGLLRPEGRLLNHAISRRPGRAAEAVADLVHRPLRVPRRRTRAARDDDRHDRGRRFRGARRAVAARALHAHAARVAGEPRSRLGPRGRPVQPGPGADLASVHRGVGTGLPGQPDRGQPGARREARAARPQRHADGAAGLTAGGVLQVLVDADNVAPPRLAPVLVLLAGVGDVRITASGRASALRRLSWPSGTTLLPHAGWQRADLALAEAYRPDTDPLVLVSGDGDFGLLASRHPGPVLVVSGAASGRLRDGTTVVDPATEGVEPIRSWLSRHGIEVQRGAGRRPPE